MVKYFVTGGSGFIGQAVIEVVLKAGHEVLALARSDASAEKLRKLGVDVIKGGLKDLDVLKQGAKSVDGGVLHLAFIHDFSTFNENCLIDRAAVEAIADALEGTGKAFVITSGNLSLAHPIGTPPRNERFTDYDSKVLDSHLGARLKTELYALSLKDRGIRSSVIRLSPTVHGDSAAGFASFYLLFSLKSNAASYIGDGLNAWSSIERYDAARLYLLAAEKGIAGHAYHGVGEESVTFKDLAEAFSKKYGLPTKSITQEEALEKYGFLGAPIGFNATVSNELTKKELGWVPKGATLLEDIEKYDYKAQFPYIL